VVFASAVPPYLLKSDDNPEGPLTQDKADEMSGGLAKDREAFFDSFTRDFFSAKGKLKVTEDERQAAIALCHQSDQTAALGCMKAFATTDFRDDLKKVSVPTLVLHGDSDATVPFEGSGKRTHEAINGSELVVLNDAPHGCNTSHADDFNLALLDFLKK
jgi:pimeloyl-ACP methyl ester carboxylesterase